MGRILNGELYSGSGSHQFDLVFPYVSAVTDFCRSLKVPPSAVDLGCGDFNIGRQIRPYCGRYIACDVVPELIEQNLSRFGDLRVEFRCLDIVHDPLPGGDVAFLRQVLQHLDNEKIATILRQLYRYRFVIVTEHLPANGGFVPNTDKPQGLERACRLGPESFSPNHRSIWLLSPSGFFAPLDGQPVEKTV